MRKFQSPSRSFLKSTTSFSNRKFCRDISEDVHVQAVRFSVMHYNNINLYFACRSFDLMDGEDRGIGAVGNELEESEKVGSIPRLPMP